MLGKLRRTLVLAGLVAVVATVVVAGGVSAKPSGGGPGNSPNAKACQKGGWENLVREDGTEFTSEEECVAYAAQGGVLQPKPSGPTPLDRCKQELADAGLSEPANANYILGTEGDDDFTSQMTAGNDVVCGFAGNDFVDTLSAGDIFLGGDGTDRVLTLDGGTFNGGAGDDRVTFLVGGTFNGEAGCDSVVHYSGGAFDGGDQSTCP